MTDQLGGTQRPGLRQTSAGGLGFLRRVISGVGVLVLSSISPLVAEVATQTDWSEGAEETGTVSVWDRSFAEAQGISWLKLFWNDGGDPLAWRDEDIGDAIVTPLVLGAGDLDGAEIWT